MRSRRHPPDILLLILPGFSFIRVPTFVALLFLTHMLRHTHFLLIVLIITLPSLLTAQSSDPVLWQLLDSTELPASDKRIIHPNVFRAYRLDADILQNVLALAPDEGTMPLMDSPALLEVPLPDGETARFHVVEYALLEPGLQSKYPELRAYYGRGAEDPNQRIRLDWTEAGFRAVIRLAEGSVFVDPYAQQDREHYLVYYKRDYPAPAHTFHCGVNHEGDEKSAGAGKGLAKAGDCQFRTYRMAIATTGEYSNFHGATSAAQSGLVLSEVMTSLNRVNDVYEVDFSIRLILVDDADDVFYYDPDTDPYSNGNTFAMLGQVTDDLNANIGVNNYDVGHVYGTITGGVASLRGVCGGSKARGVTGGSPPTNDPFWIDYVAHEVGHQFGGNHTQNNNCNRSGASYEPGSASTIMGYAGICAPNVQNNSDPYFHAISMAEVADFVVNDNGGTCSTNLPNPNSAPSVNAGSDHFIPRSTPFVLTAQASDPNPGDPLTYCWEQFDNEIGAVMPPSPNNVQGPMFRSLLPVPSPQRYFPDLATVVNNGTNTWEVLSDVSRPLDFRVTVRDNSTNAISCTDEDDLRINVTATAGPFLVTNPTNAGVEWFEGEDRTVSWDVANTNVAPVSCGQVDILLSYDGGFTYPVTLATNVPNNGSATITVPDLVSGPENQVRIMVRCSDNVFYDISNNNFTILESVSTFTLNLSPASLSICQGDNGSFTVNTSALGGFSGPVDLSATALPGGATVTFAQTTINAGASTSGQIGQTGGLAAGNYSVTITASDNDITRQATLGLTVSPSGAVVSLGSPAANATDVSSTPTFSWSPITGAQTYQIQVSTSPGFSPLVVEEAVATNSFQPAFSLDPETTYYWRVRAVSPCPGPFGPSRSFTTRNCISLVSTNLINMSPNGSNLVYTDVLTSNRSENLVSVAVPNLRGTHTWMNDLGFVLIAPDGSRIDLIDRQCGNTDDYELGLDDLASSPVQGAPCSPLGQGGTYRPVEAFAAFNGLSALGDWTLEITDFANQDGGQHQSWTLELCLEASVLPVVWDRFTATARSRDIRLDWATAAEVGNAYFVVERTTEGNPDFVEIGTTPAAENGSGGAAYDFLDANVRPGVEYFYRIRQVDFDGSFSYSEIRSAQIQPTSGELTIFPNPVNDRLGIMPGADDTDFSGYRILDAGGRVVLEQSAGFDYRSGIDCGTLPSGVYVLRLRAASGRAISRKFVVLP